MNPNGESHDGRCQQATVSGRRQNVWLRNDHKYRVQNKKGNFNATSDEPFISRLSRDNIFGLLTVMAS